mgnify:CR=1 FL=1
MSRSTFSSLRSIKQEHPEYTPEHLRFRLGRGNMIFSPCGNWRIKGSKLTGQYRRSMENYFKDFPGIPKGTKRCFLLHHLVGSLWLYKGAYLSSEEAKIYYCEYIGLPYEKPKTVVL